MSKAGSEGLKQGIAYREQRSVKNSQRPHVLRFDAERLTLLSDALA